MPDHGFKKRVIGRQGLLILKHKIYSNRTKDNDNQSTFKRQSESYLAAASASVAAPSGAGDLVSLVVNRVAVLGGIAGLPGTGAILVGAPAPLATLATGLPTETVLGAAIGLAGAFLATGQDAATAGGGRDSHGGLEGNSEETEVELHFLSCVSWGVLSRWGFW